MAKSKKATLPSGKAELQKLIRDTSAELVSLRFAFGPAKDRASKIKLGRKTIAKAHAKLASESNK